MTGPEHYREAEHLAESVTGVDVPVEQGMATIALAQVHATLALADATRRGHYDVSRVLRHAAAAQRETLS